jgi:hypothetical protein
MPTRNEHVDDDATDRNAVSVDLVLGDEVNAEHRLDVLVEFIDEPDHAAVIVFDHAAVIVFEHAAFHVVEHTVVGIDVVERIRVDIVQHGHELIGLAGCQPRDAEYDFQGEGSVASFYD